ncbi:prolipoprotein diacylglyceryl transferase [Microtetraspora sp. NBRC 16547]|uniref:prolipoprotein diacylglyceryl transferase n=1 Tax=Microtetraspora sp. NBRC 16547 TaxID=3030993 RepID=UPI0024A313FF|nr:prolipoprotein diacylglyceryl transferase [Microtetraspora sp. NBRC 16547]GLW97372.1 prolipoprotein diacylglyceryl transferase 1 [Microtetraspora sp. NBRC 16547]
MPLASIPSPSQGVWNLGPLPIRAYALCIVLGVIVAVWIGERRWRARGGEPGAITDLAVWAVPFGLVGGRLYHVITDWQLYFGSEAPNRPIDALFIWKGGLGIWGAIALGALGVWIACRRRGISFSAVADTLAPAIAVAQAIGRWGNYFNQELFGGPTTLPWGLEIEPGRPGTVPGIDTYHPTFLYESLWDLALAGLLVLAGRRFALRHGRLFSLYVAGYTLGRFWIEGMRVDPAHQILGLRLNQWTSVVIFVLAIAYFWLTRNKTGEEPLGAEPGADDGPTDGHADPAHPQDQADPDESGAEAEADAAGGGSGGGVPGGAADDGTTEGTGEGTGGGAAGSDPSGETFVAPDQGGSRR